ncbi:MAG TPA: UPF0149 family protein [Rhizomicrobium sp.]|jgi:uncharacterized protein|nr:UPF0149 family protein [Rhizomicrobium sp.]
MTDADALLGSTPLERLAAFLDSPDLPAGVMTLPELDGFIAGLVVGPQVVAAEDWLPIVWGDDGPPPFASDAERDTILAAIAALHDDVAARIADGSFAPLLHESDSGVPMPQGWCAGFMTAADLRAEAWRPLFESEDEESIAYPILAFCDDADGKPLLELSARDRRVLEADASDHIAQAVIDIADYWQHKNKPLPAGAIPVRTAPKIGRNEPCPCGSGRKYKKCCGASAIG